MSTFEVNDIKKETKRKYHLLTGLWNLNDVQNSQQNRFKNRMVSENPVT